MDEKKMQELMNDEEFVKQTMSLKTEEEVQEAFKAKGVEISIEEIKKLGEEGKTALEDGALENVSGGAGGYWANFKVGLRQSPLGAYEYQKELSPESIAKQTSALTRAEVSAKDIEDAGYVGMNVGEKAANYAGSLAFPVGVVVCSGLIYGGIKSGIFKKAYNKVIGRK